jgi:hypothetical protein
MNTKPGILKLRSSLSSEKNFCDPLHSLISFLVPEEDYLIKVISTPSFQRLRRIKQLGVSSFVFHGAEHSRFSHSLGVVFLTRQILTSLEIFYRDNPPIIAMIGKHKKAIYLAALLHDIGHGPFSHLFEAATADVMPRSHEEWSVAIIKDPDSEIAMLLKDEDRGLPEEVASIIERTHPCKLAVDLISSQLDADRIDYLQRDSMMTGTGYGKFDVEWLLKVLRIDSDGGLCVDGRKGIGAVENYMHSRYLMYVQVYFHKTGRAFEGQIINILRLAGTLLRQDDGSIFKCCPLPLKKILCGQDMSLEDYLKLDDIMLLAAVNQWMNLTGTKENELLAKHCRDFYLCRIPWKPVEVESMEIEKVSQFIEYLKTSDDEDLRLLNHSIYFDSCKTTIYRGIDYYSTESTGGHSSAIMVLEDGKTTPLENHRQAAAVRALSQVTWAAHRLYYDRDIKGTLMKALQDFGIEVNAR